MDGPGKGRVNMYGVRVRRAISNLYYLMGKFGIRDRGEIRATSTFEQLNKVLAVTSYDLCCFNRTWTRFGLSYGHGYVCVCV